MKKLIITSLLISVSTCSFAMNPMQAKKSKIIQDKLSQTHKNFNSERVMISDDYNGSWYGTCTDNSNTTKDSKISILVNNYASPSLNIQYYRDARSQQPIHFERLSIGELKSINSFYHTYNSGNATYVNGIDVEKVFWDPTKEAVVHKSVTYLPDENELTADLDTTVTFKLENGKLLYTEEVGDDKQSCVYTKQSA